jgi:hypothetical protein
MLPQPVMFEERRTAAEAVKPRIPDPARAWTPRRKLFVIVTASLLAWAAWAGLGLLIWRTVGPG